MRSPVQESPDRTTEVDEFLDGKPRQGRYCPELVTLDGSRLQVIGSSAAMGSTETPA